MNPTEAQQLRQEIVRLKQEIALRPIRVPTRAATGYPTYYLFCRSGNALATVGSVIYYGLKQPASPVLTVPTVVPSTVDGACPDGLSWGTMVADNGTLSQVWIGVNLKPTADPAITDYTGVLAYITPFISRRIVAMPLVSAPTTLVPVYMPWRV